ncbi:MAG: HEPN domain-containing protein [Rhodospirillaceae bacterium]|nr:MAG: HEPN domain-containing protein [Rhodospirillaceae bacterium]
MSAHRDPVAVWEVVDEWIAVAAADREAAVLFLHQQSPLRQIATFHCQQAAEKLLKAFCVLADQKFRKTHDMGLLTDMVKQHFPELAAVVGPMAAWTSWNVVGRYPGDVFHDIIPTAEELLEAVTVIERLLTNLQERRPESQGDIPSHG